MVRRNGVKASSEAFLTPKVVAEFGLLYGDGPSVREFVDPIHVAACRESNAFYALDGGQYGVLRLCPDSGSMERLFAGHKVTSLACLGDGGLALIIDGALVLADRDGQLKIVRSRSSCDLGYKVVSSHPTESGLAMLDSEGGAELLDESGQVLWCSTRVPFAFDAVHAAHAGRDGIVVVYERNNMLQWYSHGTGAPARRVGTPGSKYVPTGMFAPKAASLSTLGWLVADSYNNRIVAFDDNDNIVWSYGNATVSGSSEGHLWRPVSVAQGRCGHLLVADSKNGRYVLVGRDGSLHGAWGACNVQTAELRLPRSVNRLAHGGYVVSDTHNDRLVNLVSREGGFEIASVSNELAWPRCALEVNSQIWVSEGRSNQIRVGQRPITSFGTSGSENIPLHDPHEMVATSEGQILVANTGANQILRVSNDLSAEFLFRDRGLSDPHSVCEVAPGSYAVADTGNDRVLLDWADGSASEWREVVLPNGNALPLRGVRHCCAWNGGMLLTVTDLNTVVYCDLSGRVVWRFGPLDESQTFSYRDSYLHGPKWAGISHNDMLIIGDTGNSRILFVDCKPAKWIDPVPG